MLSRSDNPILPRSRPEANPTGDDDEGFTPDEVEEGIERVSGVAAISRGFAGLRPNARPFADYEPDSWEELTATEDGRFVLRHDGKLYAAREIDVERLLGDA